MSSVPPTTPPAGPFLSYAVLCEKVLREADNTISIIRIVDQVTQTAQGTDVPDEMPPAQLSLNVLISLRRGQARGRDQLSLRVEEPSGIQTPALSVPINFQGDEEASVVTQVNFNFVASSEGLYWIDVLFGSQELLLTRVPLRVIYVPQKLGSAN